MVHVLPYSVGKGFIHCGQERRDFFQMRMSELFAAKIFRKLCETVKKIVS